MKKLTLLGVSVLIVSLVGAISASGALEMGFGAYGSLEREGYTSSGISSPLPALPDEAPTAATQHGISFPPLDTPALHDESSTDATQPDISSPPLLMPMGHVSDVITINSSDELKGVLSDLKDLINSEHGLNGDELNGEYGQLVDKMMDEMLMNALFYPQSKITVENGVTDYHDTIGSVSTLKIGEYNGVEIHRDDILGPVTHVGIITQKIEEGKVIYKALALYFNSKVKVGGSDSDKVLKGTVVVYDEENGDGDRKYTRTFFEHGNTDSYQGSWTWL